MTNVTITITGIPKGPLADLAAEAERAREMGSTEPVVVSHEALTMMLAWEIRVRLASRSAPAQPTPTSTPQPSDTQTSQPSDASPTTEQT